MLSSMRYGFGTEYRVFFSNSSYKKINVICFYFRDNPVYIKFYMNLALTVILGIAPFVALIFFNIKIYLRCASRPDNVEWNANFCLRLRRAKWSDYPHPAFPLF